MNKSARLYYHLQQKEEELLKEARELEEQKHTLSITQREVDLTRRETESMLRLAKEKMENFHILYQTKMENLNTLLSLKEEGWRQKLDYAGHESAIKEILHQTEVENLNHEGKVKDLLHGEDVKRLHHTMEIKDIAHENERILDAVEHQRDLFDLDQAIASKMQEIYLLQREIQHHDHEISQKDGVIRILKEQNVLESKRSQLSGAMYNSLNEQMDWKEEYLNKLEQLRIKEHELKEEGLSLYFGNQSQELELRERELEIRGGQIDIGAKQNQVNATYDRMMAELYMKTGRLESEHENKLLEARKTDVDSRLKALEFGRKLSKQLYNSEKERFKFWKNYSDTQIELAHLKREEEEHMKRLSQIRVETAQISRERSEIEERVRKLKEGLDGDVDE